MPDIIAKSLNERRKKIIAPVMNFYDVAVTKYVNIGYLVCYHRQIALSSEKLLTAKNNLYSPSYSWSRSLSLAFVRTGIGLLFALLIQTSLDDDK